MKIHLRPSLRKRKIEVGSILALSHLSVWVTFFLPVVGVMGGEADVPDYDVRILDEGRERLISLDQAIAAALRSNLEIQIESISPQVAADRTLQAQGEFDPVLEVRTRYDSLDTPQTSQEFVSTGGSRFQNGSLIGENRVFAEENFETKTGITGKMLSGTEYDIGVRANRYRNDLTSDPFVSRFDPEYRGFAGISIIQPLLQDFGKTVNEIQIKVSRRDKAIADQTFRQTLAKIVKETVVAYFDAFLAYEDVKVKQFEVEVFHRMSEEKRDQLERGAATPSDNATVKSALAESYERFLLSRQTLLTKNGDLLIILQQEFDFDDYPVYLPIESPNGLHPPLDPNELVRQAMEHRPEYLMAVESVEKMGIVLKYRKNQMLPRVDLEGTFGYVGLSGSYGSAFSQALDGQGHEYGVGIVVRMPFGNRERKGLYAETSHQLRQAVLKVKHEELQTQVLINKHLTAVQTHEKRLEAARMSTKLEEENLEKSRESLEKGTISESAVMKVDRDVRETRLRQFAAAADLQVSLIDLWETNGTLLSRYGIGIADATGDSPAQMMDEVPESWEPVTSGLTGNVPLAESSTDSGTEGNKRKGSGLLDLFGIRKSKREVEDSDASAELDADQTVGNLGEVDASGDVAPPEAPLVADTSRPLPTDAAGEAGAGGSKPGFLSMIGWSAPDRGSKNSDEFKETAPDKTLQLELASSSVENSSEPEVVVAAEGTDFEDPSATVPSAKTRGFRGLFGKKKE